MSLKQRKKFKCLKENSFLDSLRDFFLMYLSTFQGFYDKMQGKIQVFLKSFQSPI